MGESIVGIIWFLILFGLIKKGVNKAKGGGSSPAPQRPTPPVRKLNNQSASPRPVKKRSIENYDSDFDEVEKAPHRGRAPKAGEARPAKALLKESSALSDLMVEDRHNDWLARQLREEKRHVVWNNFIDLGAAHDEACAAELNAREHKRAHQSYVVDDGITDN